MLQVGMQGIRAVNELIRCRWVVDFFNSLQFNSLQVGMQGIKLNTKASGGEDSLAAVSMVMPEDEVLLGSERGKIVRLVARDIEVRGYLLSAISAATSSWQQAVRTVMLMSNSCCWAGSW